MKKYWSQIARIYRKSAIVYGKTAMTAAFALSLSVHSSALAISHNPETGMGANQMEVEITAYSSTKDQTDGSPFIAASGKKVYDGMVAANFLPFGTKIKIPALFGDKIFTVDDRMNKRFQNRVDIWFTTRIEAIKFGVQKTIIEVVE